MTNIGSELAAAHARQTEQLHDARTALADAVLALRTELSRLQAERDQAALENRNLSLENRNLRECIAELEARIHDLVDQLAVLRNMKVVRWTARPRGIVSRLRARRR